MITLERMAVFDRTPHIDLFVEHTNAYDEQYDAENTKNEGDVEDFFPPDEFDGSNSSNDVFGNEDDDDEYKRVRKDNKIRKEELNKDIGPFFWVIRCSCML